MAWDNQHKIYITNFKYFKYDITDPQKPTFEILRALNSGIIPQVFTKDTDIPKLLAITKSEREDIHELKMAIGSSITYDNRETITNTETQTTLPTTPPPFNPDKTEQEIIASLPATATPGEILLVKGSDSDGGYSKYYYNGDEWYNKDKKRQLINVNNLNTFQDLWELPFGEYYFDDISKIINTSWESSFDSSYTHTVVQDYVIPVGGFVKLDLQSSDTPLSTTIRLLDINNDLIVDSSTGAPLLSESIDSSILDTYSKTFDNGDTISQAMVADNVPWLTVKPNNAQLIDPASIKHIQDFDAITNFELNKAFYVLNSTGLYMFLDESTPAVLISDQFTIEESAGLTLAVGPKGVFVGTIIGTIYKFPAEVSTPTKGTLLYKKQHPLQNLGQPWNPEWFEQKSFPVSGIKKMVTDKDYLYVIGQHGDMYTFDLNNNDTLITIIGANYGGHLSEFSPTLGMLPDITDLVLSNAEGSAFRNGAYYTIQDKLYWIRGDNSVPPIIIYTSPNGYIGKVHISTDGIYFTDQSNTNLYLQYRTTNALGALKTVQANLKVDTFMSNADGFYYTSNVNIYFVPKANHLPGHSIGPVPMFEVRTGSIKGLVSTPTGIYFAAEHTKGSQPWDTKFDRPYIGFLADHPLISGIRANMSGYVGNIISVSHTYRNTNVNSSVQILVNNVALDVVRLGSDITKFMWHLPYYPTMYNKDTRDIVRYNPKDPSQPSNAGQPKHIIVSACMRIDGDTFDIINNHVDLETEWSGSLNDKLGLDKRFNATNGYEIWKFSTRITITNLKADVIIYDLI